MGFFTYVAILAIVVAVAVSVAVQYAMTEVKFLKVPDQTDKLFVVTGANSGLGFHTSMALAKANGRVVMTCRDMGRCEEATAKIHAEYPAAQVYARQLDLASFQSIYDFVRQFMFDFERVDVLINNAGVMALPKRQVTVNGLEAQIGTNHFGHFLLTSLMFHLMQPNGRIVNHASGAHVFAARDFVTDDLQSEKAYDPWTAYGNSKMANLLFTYELNRRLSKIDNHYNIWAYAVHPGYTATNLQAGRFPLWNLINSIFAMKGEDGAWSQILAATDEHLMPSDNTYFGPKYVMLGAPAVTAVSSYSGRLNQTEAGIRLWQESVRIVGQEIFELHNV